MEPNEYTFLQDVSEFWDKTEDDRAQRHGLLNLTSYTKLFLERMHNTKVFSTGQNNAEQTDGLSECLEIGNQTYSLEKLISFFDKHVVQSEGLDMSKPTQFSLIPGSGHFSYTIAEYLSSISHVIAAARFSNAGACDIDASVVKWVKSIVKYPETSTGVMVSGTSMGAIIAFATARDHLLPSSKQYHQAVVYIPSYAHQSCQRGLRVAGLGDCVYRTLPSVKSRIVPGSFDKMVSDDIKIGLIPFLVIGSMGATGVGAVDSFREMFKITQQYNIWFHIDASYGGFFILDETIQERCPGLEMSDSITFDFHKGLSAPYGTSVLLVRDSNRLRSAMKRGDDPYLPEKDEPNLSSKNDHVSPLDLSFEYTRPFRSFPVWFMLKSVGTEAIKSQMTEKIKLTEYAYNTLSQMKNVSMYMKPDLTIIAFRYNRADNDVTRKWMKLINKTGEMCVTGTTEDGLLYIRLCILSFRTHLDAVKIALRTIKRTLAVLQAANHFTGAP